MELENLLFDLLKLRNHARGNHLTPDQERRMGELEHAIAPFSPMSIIALIGRPDFASRIWSFIR